MDFADIYHQCVGLVFRALRRLGIPERDLEDAAQEVFVIVHRRLSDFDPSRATMSTWIYGITRGVAANRRRADRRAPDTVTDPSLLERALAPDHEGGSNAVRLVQAFLRTLDDERRVVFELAAFDQLNPSEIAEITGMNRNTVYTRLRAARAAYDSFIQAEAADDEGAPAALTVRRPA